MNLKTLIGAAAVALGLPVMASAATTVMITNNAVAGNETLAAGQIYSQAVTYGDSLAFTLLPDPNGATTPASFPTGAGYGYTYFGLNFSPEPASFNVSFSLDQNDPDYGEVYVGLFSEADPNTLIQAGSLTGPGVVQFSGVDDQSPVYFLLAFENTDYAGQIAGDIVISAVPIPAAGFLLLAGIGGLAAVRRRKTA